MGIYYMLSDILIRNNHTFNIYRDTKKLNLDILNYNYWVLVHSRRSKSWIWVGPFSESGFLNH